MIRDFNTLIALDELAEAILLQDVEAEIYALAMTEGIPPEEAEEIIDTKITQKKIRETSKELQKEPIKVLINYYDNFLDSSHSDELFKKYPEYKL